MRRILTFVFRNHLCRLFGHDWWTEDFEDELWGSYEMLTCRRCRDWMFAQPLQHSDEIEPYDTLAELEKIWRTENDR